MFSEILPSSLSLSLSFSRSLRQGISRGRQKCKEVPRPSDDSLANDSTIKTATTKLFPRENSSNINDSFYRTNSAVRLLRGL